MARKGVILGPKMGWSQTAPAGENALLPENQGKVGKISNIMAFLERLLAWFRPVNRQITALVTLWALVGLTNLGGADLWDIDEGNNTEASREMREAGNWVVPTFNYELRVDKPALINWLQIISGMVFGEGEFAARFPSAVAGLFTILAVWTFGRVWLGGMAGFAAGLVLAGSPMFVAAMRFANPDSLLTALVSWCLIFLHFGMRSGRGVWWLFAASACSALAMLGKGPIGLALPGAILLVYLLFAGGWRRVPWFYLPGALLLWLAIAAPWYIWVGTETKFAWHKGFFLQHNLGRFSAPMENHAGPLWYYLPVILGGTFPFSSLLGLPLLTWRKNTRALLGDRFFTSGIFVAAWLAVPLVVFSISRTKLPNYVLPAYPALAIWLSLGMVAWRRGWIEPKQGWIRFGMVTLVVAGAGMVAGLLAASGALPLGSLSAKMKPLSGLEWIAPAGLILVAGGVAGLVWSRQPLQAISVVTWSGLLLTMTLGAWNGQTLNRHKAPKRLAGFLPADLRKVEARLGTFDWFQPSLVFYARRPVSRILSEKDLMVFLQQPIPAFVALPAKRWESLPNVPEGVCKVCSDVPDFYRRCDVVLVANAAAMQYLGGSPIKDKAGQN